MTLAHPASLYDILVAWQAGEIGYREALRLAKLDTLDELYEAAELSGVSIQAELEPVETAQARTVGALIREQFRHAA